MWKTGVGLRKGETGGGHISRFTDQDPFRFGGGGEGWECDLSPVDRNRGKNRR